MVEHKTICSGASHKKKPITKFPHHMSSHRVQNAHQQCSQGASGGHVRTFTLISHWPMFNDGHTYSHISLVVLCNRLIPQQALVHDQETSRSDSYIVLIKIRLIEPGIVGDKKLAQP
jgi:hypothetical protein